MSILNTDTQTSPGIGLLPDGIGFSALGGCIIDIVGANSARLTAQIATSRMFYGWTGPDGALQQAPYAPAAWLILCTETFDPTGLAAALGGGITKANIRLTLYDGDSGSPNPVYVAQFGAGNFPYKRWSTQPSNYDFDGGQNLFIGFEDVSGNPVNCGYMGERTTYRLAADYSTVESFTGFPGVYALTDPGAIHPNGFTTPPFYYAPGAYVPPFAVTGWFAVTGASLAKLYAKLLTGSIKIGLHDTTPGDQFYDFMQGLAADVQNIPLITLTPEPDPTPPPTITCGNPPAGHIGVEYSHRMVYQVSTEFFTLAVTAGALPAGLSISSLGFIAGTPILAGTFSYTVTITDSTGQTDSVTCSIAITAPTVETGGNNVAF